MPLQISCIVEGHGELESVPILVRRIANTVDPTLVIEVTHIRVPRNKIVKPGELERAVELAALRSGGGILLLMDSDDDCPAVLGPQLLARIHQTRTDRPSAVVLANKEFETWFLAAAESLRGQRRLPEDLESPLDVEGIRGAKEWIKQRVRGATYSPTVDQAALTAVFDLDQARRAPSFNKCHREIVRLIEELR